MDTRTICAAFVIAALSAAAAASAGQADVFDQCAQDRNSTTRLACFDRAVAARDAAGQASARTAGPVSPIVAPAVAPVATPPAGRALAVPAAASPAPSDIGLDAVQRRREREERGEPEIPPPAPIEARIVKVIRREPSISAFELDNGQIWEESEATKMAAAPKEKVTIRQGVLGAFFLKIADGSVVRVHRLR